MRQVKMIIIIIISKICWVFREMLFYNLIVSWMDERRELVKSAEMFYNLQASRAYSFV